MSQSNTKIGDIVIVAGEDLSNKEGYLVEIRDDSGTAKAYLPNSNDDYALYAIIDGGAASGDRVVLRPLSSDRNFRIELEGACSPGDVLVLADTATAEDKGKVRALPAAADTYRGLALAEETGLDGQLVLARPYALGLITVS